MLLLWFGIIGCGSRAWCSTAMANADAFCLVREIYPKPGRYETVVTTAIMQTTYLNNEDSNVSKSGRGGGTQPLDGRKRASQPLCGLRVQISVFLLGLIKKRSSSCRLGRWPSFC